MPLGIARLNTLARLLSEAAPTRTPKTITAVGNAQVSTAQSKFGGASALFDGSGDSLSVANNSSFNVGSGDWTVESYVRFNVVTGDRGIFSYFANQEVNNNNDYRGINIRFSSNVSPTGLRTVIRDGASSIVLQSAWSPSVNTWYHVAVVRNGSSLKTYIDGTQIGSTTINISVGSPTSAPLLIGESQTVANSSFDGYIDEVRYSNTARYTSNFTPSNSAFTNDANTLLLIHADGYTGYTTFIDDGGQTIQTPARGANTITSFNSAAVTTSQSKFGTGSLDLNGSNQYLRIYNTANTLSLANDFTIECWLKPKSTSDTIRTIFWNPPTGHLLYLTRGTNWGIYLWNGSSNVLGADSNISINTNNWYHVAMTRSNGSVRMFIDGQLIVGPSTYTGTLFNGAEQYIGYYSGNYTFAYIDEFRISNTARYTSAFTPSTSAFTNDADTVLLMHADDYNGSTDFIDDNGVNPVFSSDSYSSYLKLAVPFDKYYGVKDVAYLITGSGSTSARTQGSSSTMSSADSYWNTYPYYGSSLLNTRDGSALTYNIDGNIPSSASGTFVVEGWFKPTDNTTNQNWVLSSADNNGRWLFGFNTGASISFGSENNIGFGSSTWQHVAIVCDAGTKRFYLNGVYKGAWVSDNAYFSPLHVGQFNSGDANDYRGYIQDFRVYVGTNKGYTGTNASAANFTLPTSIIASY